MIRIMVGQVVRDRVDDALRDLTAGRAVEINGRLAANLTPQRWKLPAAILENRHDGAPFVVKSVL